MKTLMKLKHILTFLCTVFTLNLIAQSNYNAFDFIENKGQWDQKITYKTDVANGAFFLRKTGFTVLQHNAADLTELAERNHGHPEMPSGENTGFEFKHPSGTSTIP